MHKYLGDDVIIYSTDPPSVIQRGTLPGEEVYSYAPPRALIRPSSDQQPAACARDTTLLQGWLQH